MLQTSVERQPGQVVRFVERGGPVLRELARSSGGSASAAFTPGFGPGGRRSIVAVVEQDGRPRMELELGSYVAPAPLKPGRPGAIRIVRRGGAVTATWGAARRAAGGYEVFVQLPDGRTVSRLQRGRRIVVRGLRVRGAVVVTVRGVRAADEATGAPRTARGGGAARRR
ncbi:MAG: hypothetical protein PGN13_15415 [Patulibacter minatonensis]